MNFQELPNLPNHFHLLQILGRGSFGKVYKAYDDKSKKFICLKYIESSNDQMQEIAHEKEILMKLSQTKHPSFLSYEGIYKHEKEGKLHIVIAMEYGIASLSDILKLRIKYSESEVIYILTQILDGCAKLQTLNIAHGDLKPSNIILIQNEKKEFKYKIADFGSSIIVKNSKNDKVWVDTKEIKTMTRGYSSPEVKKFFMKGLQSKNFTGSFSNTETQETNFYDPFKADVYSLGILTLKLLGFHMKKHIQKVLNSLESQNIDEIFQKKGFGRIVKIIKRMLLPNPEDRFSFEQLLKTLSKFGVGEKPDESLMVQKIFQKEQIPQNLSEPQKLEIFKELIPIYYKENSFDLCKELAEEAIKMIKNGSQVVEKQDNKSKEKIYAFWIEWLSAINFKKGKVKESIKLYQEACQIWEGIYGKEFHHLVSIYYNMAYIFEKNEEYENAIETLKNIKNRLTLLYGEKHNKTTKCLLKISNIYEKLNKFDICIEIHTQVIHTREKIYGKKDKNLGLYYNNQAMLLRKNNKLADAIIFHLEANKLFSQSQLEKNDVLAKSYSNTSNTYGIMKIYQKAVEFQEKALKVYQNHNQNDNLILINECYTYLSEYYQKLKDLKQVLIYEEKSLEILKKTYTSKNEKTIKKIMKIASVHKELGNYELAIANYEKALKKLNKNNSPKELIASCMNNMGILYRSVGNLIKAVSFGENALEIYLEIFGENNIQIAISYNNIGLAYQEKKEYPNAITNFEKAIKIFESINEPKSKLSCLNNLASIYKRQKNYFQAIEITKKSLALCQEISQKSPLNAQICQITSNLGALYAEIGNLAEAKKYQTQAFEKKIEFFGEYNEETLTSINLLASLEKKNGNFSISLELYTSGLAISKRIVGETHVLTKGIANKITEIKKILGNQKEENFKREDKIRHHNI